MDESKSVKVDIDSNLMLVRSHVNALQVKTSRKVLQANLPALSRSREVGACGVWQVEHHTRVRAPRPCLPCPIFRLRFKWSVWSLRLIARGYMQSCSLMLNLILDRKLHFLPIASSRIGFLITGFGHSRFNISPGEEALKTLYEQNKHPDAAYQQFSSYPTAFIVAADIELSVRRLL